jgi:apolipoprotein N-acyltransferase
MMPDDPVSFVRTLGAAGVSDDVVGAAARHPLTVFGSAKRDAWRRVDHPLFKFAAFSLVPTLPLFRLRQFLVYGGTFGEYYQYGLKVYLLGFGLFWLLYAVYLVLYAAALRAVTEAVSFAAAFAIPERAGSVRRVAETVHRILYFLGTPAVLALRFYPW